MNLDNYNTNNFNNTVTNIASFGFWFLCDEKEYFVSFKDYPVFKKASIDSIFNVKQLSPKQFYWEDLDVDIEIDALEKPDDFPLSFNK